MPVGLQAPKSLLAVDGIRLSAAHSGIKADSQIKDLVLIEIDENASVSAVFTSNRFCAAPVTVARQHLEGESSPRYLLVNSGNANAGTGQSGYQNAITSCQAVAESGGIPISAVLPFSTGVIAEQLPVGKIQQAVPGLFENLNPDAWLDAAQGIMTTDTLPKAVSRVVQIDGTKVTITGIAKGSGMIRPDMATMLAFIATDAQIEKQLLDRILKEFVDKSFNAITVDGDTSTNDACVLIATGRSEVQISEYTSAFKEALLEVFQYLAQSIIRDAEGATKFVEVAVSGAASIADARSVAYAVAHSPLVKTALFASDPNWGRILAAIGRAEAGTLDIERINLYLGNTCLLKNGLPDASYQEAKGQSEMSASEITIRIELGVGEAAIRLWTSDLSYDYVKINAEYRS